MIWGVDGTGPFWNKDYQSEMARSFVSQICRMPGGRYYRGSDAIDSFLSGPNPRVVAEAIRMTVVPMAGTPKFYRTGFAPTIIDYPTSNVELGGLKDKVFLTGYSRGGSTVLDVAVILKGYGIPVEAMFLFDAVTRSPWLSGNVVPSNVKNCYHAMRNPRAKSRESFGNSPAIPEKGVNYVRTNHFFTTHAGLGGTLWSASGLIKPVPRSMFDTSFKTPTQIAENMVADEPEKYADKIFEPAPDWAFTAVTVKQELLGMNEVRGWMWPHLNRHGLFP